MSANDSLGLNSTQPDNFTFVGDGSHVIYTYIDCVVLFLSVCSLIIGIASWSSIKKFRHFKNYVFVNAILSSALSDTAALLYTYYRFNYSNNVDQLTFLWLRLTYHATITYFGLATHCWLLVMCWIFYVDIVKVFGGDVSRRYFKSSLFAWGGPFILSFTLPIILLSFSKFIDIEMITLICALVDLVDLFIPLLISFCVYVKVIVTLFKSSDVSRTAVKTRRLYIATLIFLLSGVLFVLMPLWFVVDLPYVTIFVIKHLQTISMSVYLMIVKSNRDLWREYYSKFNKSNGDSSMQRSS